MATIKFSKIGLLNMMGDLESTDDLILVGDHGIYIMSPGHKNVISEGELHPLEYARGCDPETDEDFYDNKVALYGGDDGADQIGTVGDLRKLLEVCEDELHVKMTTTQIITQSDVATPSKASINVADLPPELRKYV